MPNKSRHITPAEAVSLLKMVNYFHPISKAIENYIIKHSYPYSIKRGCLLINHGEVCDKIFFIKKGAIRAFIKEGKKDITTWITVENELVTAITSFNLQAPALENIQALEDTDMIVMSFEDLQNLYQQFPEYNIIGRKVYEKYYFDAEIRALIARISKAEKKYEYFLKVHSHLANRVPLKYIASYLGISLETLSRIRGQMLISAKNKV
ncbi:Crp/Fnr family transcriptional regulator [Ferruginibacter sp. SUN002]|uniref:Crp/Fnr family transcriptional regulator n=1 Tax=Ferruginibacter sp. SUN002 TaxID=2937789 RepID=UPI003D36BB56